MCPPTLNIKPEEKTKKTYPTVHTTLNSTGARDIALSHGYLIFSFSG